MTTTSKDMQKKVRMCNNNNTDALQDIYFRPWDKLTVDGNCIDMETINFTRRPKTTQDVMRRGYWSSSNFNNGAPRLSISNYEPFDGVCIRGHKLIAIILVILVAIFIIKN